MHRPAVLVSACLLGQCVRYDGQTKPIDLSELRTLGLNIIPVCPECSGGLPVPRDPCEIEAGKTAKDVWRGSARVVSIHHKDCTKQYVSGAKNVLHSQKIMMQNSPCSKKKAPPAEAL